MPQGLFVQDNENDCANLIFDFAWRTMNFITISETSFLIIFAAENVLVKFYVVFV